MPEIFLGLGSNLGSKMDNLKMAVAHMQNVGLDIIGMSKVYQTEPFGVKEQPVFYNMVLRAFTTIEPRELLAILKGIERKMGRGNNVRWGPRIIDIDILLYNDIILKYDDLCIPHPGILERYFVLLPMYELCRERNIPGTGMTVAEAFEKIRGSAKAEPVGEIELT